ncbi:MAG TPA: hypothetical protein VNL14_20515 [Candidatus Acidoferrales bacterium]|nr:hypothetical protein [Candidatus Acidoferrales bacterium]
MSKEILVAMKSQDRIEDIIPCLEGVAQPGTKVTFLFRYPVDGFVWPQEDAETAAAAFEAGELSDYYSWEANVKRAEKKVSPALEVLRQNGMEASVDVYAGSLSKVVKRCASEGDVTVVTYGGVGQWITSFFNGPIFALQVFKRPSFSSAV